MRTLIAALVALSIGAADVADLWSDDFESAAALSANYTGIIDAEVAAGVGRAGSYGVRTTGTSQQQYYGEFTKLVTTSSRGGTATAWFDHAYVGNDAGGYDAIRVASPAFGAQFFLTLYHDVGTHGVKVVWRNEAEFPDPESAVVSNAYVPGTHGKLALLWCMSTINEAFESNPDGRIQVYVGDALIIDEQGIRLVSWVNDNTWDRVSFGPMGNLDEVGITDEGCDSPPPSAPVIDVSTPCCVTDTGPGGSTGPILEPEPTQGAPLPEWESAGCGFGGVVPTADDVVHSESWAFQ